MSKSLDGINIVFAIENEFGINIPDEGAQNLRSVRETVALYAGFYRHPRPIDEVLALTGLEDQVLLCVALNRFTQIERQQ